MQKPPVISCLLRPHVVVAAGVFLFSLAVLIYNAAPGISFHDSGEFALAAASFGLTHPPGAPTWTLLAGPFAHLLGFKDYARAANCFSATMGATSLALLFLLTNQLIAARKTSSGHGASILASLAAPAVLLNSESFLEQSFAAEQYTLLTALLLLFLLLLGWGVQQIQTGLPTEQSPVARWHLFAIGMIAGVAMGNHPSQVCLLPGILVLVGLTIRLQSTNHGFRTGIACLAGLVAGLLVFTYLPVCAATRPMLDAVSATSWDRFMAALSRKVYQPRSLASLPPHFVSQLLKTYNFMSELGLIGSVLAVVGLSTLLRSRHLLHVLPIAVIAIYAVGMLWGFLRQNFDTFFLIMYGIGDWHLPLYAGGGLLAALGLAELLQWTRVRDHANTQLALSLSVVLAIVLMAAVEIRRSSLRDFHAPQRFLKDMWRAMPRESFTLVHTDNASMMLSYYSCRTGENIEPQRIVHGQLEDLSTCMRKQAFSDGTSATLHECLRRLANVDSQPLNLPAVSNDSVASATILTDDHQVSGPLRDRILPAGFLFRLADNTVSTTEIVKAEDRWRTSAPEMYESPQSGARIHRLEREARGGAFWRRAGYFYARQLYELARADYQRALEWSPNNGQCWHGLGLCLERISGDKTQAIAAYREALRHQKWLAGPRNRLRELEQTGAN